MIVKIQTQVVHGIKKSLALLLIIGLSLSICSANARSAELPQLIDAKTESSIKRGLAYLARSQNRDGSWTSKGAGGGGYPTAMTALAGMAMVGAGNTPLEGKYANNVRRATDFLVKVAEANRETGVIAVLATERSCMHGHGFAMLFLAEVYGMERDERRQRKLKRVLQKAIVLAGKSQSGAGGWYYTPNSSSDEGSITVAIIQGLRACRNAGIKVPKTIIDKACDYIQKSSNSDGGISYRVGSGGSRPALTSAAVAVMYGAGQYEHKVAKGALNYVKRMLKNSRNQISGGHKFYSIMYTAQAMYLSSGMKGEEKNWTGYFPSLRRELLTLQQSDGSWNGDYIGTVYGTAIALMSLQLPYENLPVFQK